LDILLTITSGVLSALGKVLFQKKPEYKFPEIARLKDRIKTKDQFCSSGIMI
jgi:hypothetical protein